MSWYKHAQEVQVTSWSNEGMDVIIDNKRYWVPGYNPRAHNHLRVLIRKRLFGPAKQLLKNLGAERIPDPNDPQMKLFSTSQSYESEFSKIVVTNRTRPHRRGQMRQVSQTYKKPNASGDFATISTWVPEDQLDRFLNQERSGGAEIIQE